MEGRLIENYRKTRYSNFADETPVAEPETCRGREKLRKACLAVLTECRIDQYDMHD